MFSIHTLRKSVSFEPARSAFCHKFFPAIPVSCLIPNSKESSVGVYTELLKIYHTLVKYISIRFKGFKVKGGAFHFSVVLCSNQQETFPEIAVYSIRNQSEK